MKRLMVKNREYGNQRGFGLVDTLAAVAILGTAVVAFVAALSTGAISTGEHEQQTIAKQLAQTQLEYVKSYTYEIGAITYPVIPVPEGHAVSVVVSDIPGTDADIQMITVTVYRDSANILQISDYKVNR